MEDGDSQKEMDTPEMRALVKAAFAGNHMSFGFTALEVVASTGEIWDDGKTTTIKIPMANLIDKTAPSFSATLRYRTPDGGVKSWSGFQVQHPSLSVCGRSDLADADFVLGKDCHGV